MNSFDPTEIAYFAELGEHDYVTNFNMVVDRYVVPIVEGTYIYSYPEYVYNIRRITYRGRKLDPFSGKEQIWSGSNPGTYSGGEPREYIYNYYGKKQIRLFPTPAESLRTDLDPWSGTGIREQMVITFYRSPDFTNEYLRMPEWVRTLFLDNYIVKEISKMDSDNFDTKTIQYFEGLYQKDIEDMTEIFWTNIFLAVTPIMNPTGLPISQKPGRPQLPWQFGVNNRG